MESRVTGGRDTAAESCGSGDDKHYEDDAVTDEDVHGSQDVHCPVTPATRLVQLLVEIWQPDTEHPKIAADEPRQQKAAQQKLRKPAHINLLINAAKKIFTFYAKHVSVT